MNTGVFIEFFIDVSTLLKNGGPGHLSGSVG